MPDGAVFSCRVHGLKDQQDGVAIGRIEKLLLRAELLAVLAEKVPILVFDLYTGSTQGRPFFEVDLISLPHLKIL